ncbi:MAG: GrpB family protein [Eggerthellaceae bacterium]|nr:GrpB family protein [Eggerthellaceae bacterium]
MSIGLKRGTVRLEDHQTAWEESAAEVAQVLRDVLGDVAVDVQHVGSTAIPTIKAKPIVDLAVAVADYEKVLALRDELEACGVVFRLDERPEQLLFAMGDFAGDTRTHHIHVVLADSTEWRNYLLFRDYLIANPEAARRYEAEKLLLAKLYPENRESYTAGKETIVAELLREASGRGSE